jgi:DNA invertase Pin-like site-specific DNA recombinase
MNFNYRDFFIHNDDLHIIKEQLSINEVGAPKQDALERNAKAVWDMYQTENNEQEIAKKLGINLTTVQKIVKICSMKFIGNKKIKQITDETNFNKNMIHRILNKAIPDWERNKLFFGDALEIYNLHKQGKSTAEIVNSINQNRELHLQTKEEKVNLVLTIVDIATKQMENDGVTNSNEIKRQINGAIDNHAIIDLIKKLGIGKIRYYHKFTPEQDAFILFNYLQGLNLTETARKFNTEFSTESNNLNVHISTIRRNLINILKSDSESEISEYALELLTKYYPTVDINNDKLKNYTPAKTVGSKDPLARRKGKVDPTRQMSGKKGNLERNIHKTITTGQIPASGQLGKKYGAPINTQGALAL